MVCSNLREDAELHTRVDILQLVLEQWREDEGRLLRIASGGEAEDSFRIDSIFHLLCRRPKEHAKASKSPGDRLAVALGELQRGRFVMVSDDAARENEVDLVLPAHLATPGALSFLVKHTRLV